jgi:hypothetical protein
MQNSYLIAKPHHKIIDDLLSVHLEYWKKEKTIGHYFFFQIMFNQMMQRDEWKSLNCEIVCYADFHRLLITEFDRFDQARYNQIIQTTHIHKLSLYWAKKMAKGKVPVGSFADVIINEKIREKS